MKQYGFRLLDRDTQRLRKTSIGRTGSGNPTYMNDQQHAIERIERESPLDELKPAKEGELGTERSSN
jgi:hypothetical protein